MSTLFCKFVNLQKLTLLENVFPGCWLFFQLPWRDAKQACVWCICTFALWFGWKLLKPTMNNNLLTMAREIMPLEKAWNRLNRNLITWFLTACFLVVLLCIPYFRCTDESLFQLKHSVLVEVLKTSISLKLASIACLALSVPVSNFLPLFNPLFCTLHKLHFLSFCLHQIAVSQWDLQSSPT